MPMGLIVRDEELPVLHNEEVAERTFLLDLGSGEIAEHAKPGQFVMIRPGRSSNPLLRRPFSICGKGRGQTLRILYKVVGQGTEDLSRARKNDPISVLGPLGRGYALHGPETLHLLVGGGVGIAPLLFLQGFLGKKNVLFFAGYRKDAEAPDLRRLFGFRDQGLREATEDGSRGWKGLVTEMLAWELSVLQGQRAMAVYACGPVPMLRAIWDLARVRRLPCQVSVETRMACGMGACLGCALKTGTGNAPFYAYACRDGPVFDAGFLDWESL